MRFIRSIVFALLGVFSFFGCQEPKEETPVVPSPTLKVLYWNIQNGMWSDQGNNYDNFVSWVKSYNPDVCIWCEARSNYQTGKKTAMPKDKVYLPDGWGTNFLKKCKIKEMNFLKKC